MVLVKQELDEDNSINSEDQWLFEWSNDPNINLVKQEDIQPPHIKTEADIEQQRHKENKPRKTSRRKLKEIQIQKNQDNENAGSENKVRVKTITDTTDSTLNNAKVKNNCMDGKISYDLESNSFQEELQHAEVSDSVSNLCEYHCPKCDKMFKVRDTFYTHLRKTNHASAQSKNANDYLTKIVAHECHICSKNILCDKKTIRQHILRSHKNTSYKSYIDKTCLKQLGKKTRNQIEFQDFMHKTKKKQEPSNLSSTIGNFCKFSCLHCDHACSSWKAMRNHIRKFNHGPLLPLIKYVTSVKYHKCILCKEVMLCDLDVFSRHLIKKDKLSIKKYRKTVNGTEMNNLQLQYVLKLKSLIKNIPVVEPRLEKVLKPDALADCCATKNSGNLSFLKCNQCYRNSMSLAAFIFHCKDKHQLKQPSFDISNVEEARYHNCHICYKNIFCDNRIISGHVLRSHKITLSKYQKEYVHKSGHKVFPTFQEYLRNNNVFKPFTADKNIENN